MFRSHLGRSAEDNRDPVDIAGTHRAHHARAGPGISGNTLTGVRFITIVTAIVGPTVVKKARRHSRRVSRSPSRPWDTVFSDFWQPKNAGRGAMNRTIDAATA